MKDPLPTKIIDLVFELAEEAVLHDADPRAVVEELADAWFSANSDKRRADSDQFTRMLTPRETL